MVTRGRGGGSEHDQGFGLHAGATSGWPPVTTYRGRRETRSIDRACLRVRKSIAATIKTPPSYRLTCPNISDLEHGYVNLERSPAEKPGVVLLCVLRWGGNFVPICVSAFVSCALRLAPVYHPKLIRNISRWAFCSYFCRFAAADPCVPGLERQRAYIPVLEIVQLLVLVELIAWVSFLRGADGDGVGEQSGVAAIVVASGDVVARMIYWFVGLKVDYDGNGVLCASWQTWRELTQQQRSIKMIAVLLEAERALLHTGQCVILWHYTS